MLRRTLLPLLPHLLWPLLLLWTAPLRAAAPMYEMELLIFENTTGHSDEQWPIDPGQPDFGDSIAVFPGAEPGHGALPHPRFQARRPHRLDGAARALEKAGGYRVVAHLAWLQPSLPERRVRPVHLHGGGTIPGAWLERPATEVAEEGVGQNVSERPLQLPELDGTARVSVGKYLHLNLDLLFQRRLGADDGVAAGDRVYRSYRFTQHRRMRSGEIHYLDHPYLGILAHATPIEAAKPAAEGQ